MRVSSVLNCQSTVVWRLFRSVFHGGISRYIKFEYFFKDRLKSSDYGFLSELAVNSYGKIVKKALKECSYIPGVLPFLEHVRSLKSNCFLVSGGAQDELREVFKYRNIGHFFKGIYGSPSFKSDIVDRLRREEKNFDPVLYFGDSKLDMEIAQIKGMDFVFVSGMSEWKEGRLICCERGHVVVPDFREFLNHGESS